MTLNDFYSTNIFSPFLIAKHIVELDIDKKLIKGDLKLVNDLAKVSVSESKTICFYSFASKYCSHHKPNIYPIYDNYVSNVLYYWRKIDTFLARVSYLFEIRGIIPLLLVTYKINSCTLN